MTHFAMPVSLYMNEPVVTIAASASLTEVQRTLHDAAISCVCVLDDDEQPVGVISRTDLLRVGRVEAKKAGKGTLLNLPDKCVRDVMHREVITVAPSTPVSQAADIMVRHRIHRVFVREDDWVSGVFSTKEVLSAICDKRVSTPISEFMTSPVFTVPVSAKVSLAVDRLAKAHISGLVVIDEDEWPVGTFTQNEGLFAQDLPEDTPLDGVMSYAMLCLHVRTPLYRAAAHAHATRARRVLAVEAHQVKGILTGLDFARAIR